MLLTFSLCLLLSGTAGQTGRLQPMSGIQPMSLKAQAAPEGRSRFFHTGFPILGSLAWQTQRPGPTAGVSPPLPRPPAHLPLANLPPSKEGPHKLIAFKTGNIYLVREYRIEGERIRYQTNYGGENTVPLSALDLERTRSLNADRQVPFEVTR